MGKKRFAPIIRVSTEAQEKKGESLRTQKAQIEQYVESLGGVIPDSCWQYSGQEHATPDHERKKLDRLLADSSKDLFDAVIVCDPSRWSRDNSDSKEKLGRLFSNGIEFYIGTTKFVMSSPHDALFLGMSTEINEFFAREQSRKSRLNRIERAKRGIPTAGKFPYGRTFEKKTGKWDIVESEKKTIEVAAEKYLAGERLPDIARLLGMNPSNLWKILTKKSGDVWPIHFKSTKYEQEVTVEMKVPPLLSVETIEAIRERAAGNKTYTHGHIKNQYLLSHMILCAKCGHAMFGQTNHGRFRYYRHPRDRVQPCDPSIWIRADEIEDEVLLSLVGLFGDVANVEKSMRRAIPNLEKVQELERKSIWLEDKLASVKAEHKRAVDALTKGIVTDEEIREKLAEIREQEAYWRKELEDLRPRINNIPSEKCLRRRALAMKSTARSLFGPGCFDRIDEMTHEEKRRLMQHVFSGKDQDGRRFGVYVERSEKPGIAWNYTLKGVFHDLEGELVQGMRGQEIQEIDGVVPEQCRGRGGFTGGAGETVGQMGRHSVREVPGPTIFSLSLPAPVPRGCRFP